MRTPDPKCLRCGGPLTDFAFWLPRFGGDVCLKCFKVSMYEMEGNGAKRP